MPAADLGRLAACVTEEVLVSGVRGGLGPLLGSLRCRLIVIKNVSLTPAETRSLVTAMTTCLKTVFLGRYDRIELFDFDINAFGNKLPPPDIGIIVHWLGVCTGSILFVDLQKRFAISKPQSSFSI